MANITSNFIRRYGMDIATAIKDTNIFFQTAIAQACLESGYGSSSLAKNHNNFKGITGKPYPAIGKTSSGFAIFKNPYDCFYSYGLFITTLKVDAVVNGKKTQVLRYRKGLESKTPEDQIYQFVLAGYCTSPPNWTPQQIATNYLATTQANLKRMRDLGVGGKIGQGGISLSDFQTSLVQSGVIIEHL